MLLVCNQNFLWEDVNLEDALCKKHLLIFLNYFTMPFWDIASEKNLEIIFVCSRGSYTKAEN